ncbi:MAG: hypothetical protein K6C36_07660 [Clostridia bacterium]|nr:hypothetical protein [Clostridia bacterium]
MDQTELRIDPSKKYQTFEGFGASGAWWAQLVGSWSCRDEISKLLFDKNDGIGLSTYRYNIGAGSSDSGRGNIDNPLRRTHSLETPCGIDPSRDANAVYMMQRAVFDGAREVILFVNSPLERLTKNHLSHCTKGRFPMFPAENLPEENYGDFARYCLDVAQRFVSEGVPVGSISPVNEPLWVWLGSQEGCHYSPRSAGRVMLAFAREMAKRPELSGVRLSGLENGDIRWLNKTYTRELFRYPEVRALVDAVDVHSYFLNPVPVPFFRERVPYLKRFSEWMSRRYPDKKIRMSEWCHMQGGRDRTMTSALVMANVMFEDLTVLNASAWQHWIAVSEVDYCDGLIYIDLTDGSFETTKRYFVTGNFSKYIPYGARRIEAACGDAGLRTLAFEKDGAVTAVVINGSNTAKRLGLPAAARAVVTDDGNDLREYPCADSREIGPRSVTTLLFEKLQS